MKLLLQKIGTLVFWCSWPAFYIYLRRSERTRIVVINRQGEVLVVKQWISPGKWILPGGGIHKGEPLVQAALRELGEETGLLQQPNQLRHVGQAQHRQYGHSYPFHVFVTRADEARPRTFDREIAEMRWIKPADLNSGNATQDVLQALQIAKDNSGLLQ